MPSDTHMGFNSYVCVFGSVTLRCQVHWGDVRASLRNNGRWVSGVLGSVKAFLAVTARLVGHEL
jgi:hypothetical protein